jgi:hypothetical protein
LKDLEAAIGIEPMNKGFAELGDVFAYVPRCSLVSIFIGIFEIRVCA